MKDYAAVLFVLTKRETVIFSLCRFWLSASIAVAAQDSPHAIVWLAAEKSNQARRRVIESINELHRTGAVINFNSICTAAVFLRPSS